MKALDERFVKLRMDDSHLRLKQVNQKGVILNDRYIILEKTDATSEMLGLCERAPLLIEDVLIFLNGGVHSVPAD